MYTLEDPSSLHYCRQVTVSEFENQRLSNSQRALINLLDEIVTDETMPQKYKKKRLKQVRILLQLTLPDQNYVVNAKLASSNQNI